MTGRGTASSGFTLVEVGVIVPIIMVMAIALFSIMFAELQASGREQVKLDQTYQQSDALRRIEGDVRLSTSFLETNDAAASDPYGPDNDGGTWGIAGNGTDRVLIMRQYATVGNPQSSLRQPIYTLNGGASDCSSANNLAGLLTYDIVYFVADSTLYRRTLPDLTTHACNRPYEKLSCPSAASLGGNRDGTCGADDEVVADNVSGFGVDYYADQSTATPLNAYGAAGTAETATSINVAITSTQQSAEGPVTTSTALRSNSQNTNLEDADQ